MTALLCVDSVILSQLFYRGVIGLLYAEALSGVVAGGAQLGGKYGVKRVKFALVLGLALLRVKPEEALLGRLLKCFCLLLLALVLLLPALLILELLVE